MDNSSVYRFADTRAVDGFPVCVELFTVCEEEIIMKHTIFFLTLIVTVAICCNGLAVTVNYGTHAGAGVMDWHGNFLPNGSLVELRWTGYD